MVVVQVGLGVQRRYGSVRHVPIPFNFKLMGRMWCLRFCSSKWAFADTAMNSMPKVIHDQKFVVHRGDCGPRLARA
jgi:hypothetical protein